MRKRSSWNGDRYEAPSERQKARRQQQDLAEAAQAASRLESYHRQVLKDLARYFELNPQHRTAK